MICSKFHLATIKQAREVICKFRNPDAKGYNGPHGKKSVREKQVHAFEEIYSKLCFLDSSEATSPVIACPSNELHLISSDSLCESATKSLAGDRLTALEVAHNE